MATRKSATNPDKSFQQDLLARLGRQHSRAVGCVARVLLRRPEKWGISLSVEIGFGHLDEGLPISAHASDADGDQLGVEVEGEVFLAGAQNVFPRAMRVFTTKEWRSTLERAPNALDLAAPILLRWFVGIWNDAGGASFPLRATVALHDSGRPIPLVSRRFGGSGRKRARESSVSRVRSSV